jgi:cytochrome c oxidase subunit IV
MNEILRGIDRTGLVKAVAIYLLIYGVLNVCAGLALTFAGGMAGLMGASGAAMLSQSGISSLEGGSEAIAAVSTATTFGGLAFVWGLLALVSVPLFLVVAFGLFQRKRWARTGAIIALGATILLSLLGFDTGGIMNLLWIVVSGYVLYLFLTDEGIRMVLSN